MENKVQIKRVCVGMLGTNCYILSLQGRGDCLLIDPGAEAGRIRDTLCGRQIAAILLTHGHFDHIGAVDGLMQADTALVLHEADAPMLSSPELNVSWLVDEPVTAKSKPTVLLRGGETLSYAGITLQVLHTPGHTPGGVCYQLPGMLFTGDTMFENGYGRTDFPGGSEAQLIASLRRLYRMRGDHAIYGGHG